MAVDDIRFTRRYKAGNYGFRILFKLIDATTKEPHDLSQYDEVKFKMWLPGYSDLYLDELCVITDASHGECSYRVHKGDFDSLGIYNAEVEMSNNGILEDSETFEVVIYGTAPSRCPDNVVGEYVGDIPMYFYTEGQGFIEYTADSDLTFTINVNSTYST